MTPPTKSELLALRGPLCSAEIAASLLERETLGPARRLAETIRLAISEVDDRIEFLAREFYGAEPAPRQTHDVASLFGDVMRRVVPALAARGVSMTLIDGDLEAQTESPALVRRCLLAMLRFGSASPGSLELSVGWLLRGEELGVWVEAQQPAGTAASGSAFAELQRFAERERIELQATPHPAIGSSELIAWLPLPSATAGAHR